MKAPSELTPSGATRADADQLVRIGAVVFFAGALCILAAVVPLFFGAHDLPTALNVAAGVLAPLGFALALWGLVRGARAAGRARRQANSSGE